MYLLYNACPWPRTPDAGFEALPAEDNWYVRLGDPGMVNGGEPWELMRMAFAHHADGSPTTVIFQNWTTYAISEGVYSPISTIEISIGQFIFLRTFFNVCVQMCDDTTLGQTVIQLIVSFNLEFFYDVALDEFCLYQNENMLDIHSALLQLMLTDNLAPMNGEVLHAPSDDDAVVPEAPAESGSDDDSS